MGWYETFGTSVFTKMTQEAQLAGAINLAQGFPDFDGPDVIKEAAIAAIRSGGNQYAPAPGIPLLRQRLSERFSSKYDVSYSPDTEITVVSGATEAIFLVMRALHRAGDEIITFAPFYDSYEACAKLCGITFKTVDLHAPTWSFDPEELEKQITPQTRSILVNTPHNPTGKVFSKDELNVIAELAKKHQLTIITDEVYEELVFDHHQHHPMASLPGMRERTVVMSSAAKNFSMTGWKIGYIFAPETMTREIRAVHQFIVFCSATPLQYGIAEALALGDDYYTEYLKEYEERREFLCDTLDKAGFQVFRPMGTYFVIADYTSLSDMKDYEFASWLVREKGVAAIPTSSFYLDKERAASTKRHLRFAFCKNIATIQQARERLL